MSFTHPALAVLSVVSLPFAFIAQRVSAKMQRRCGYAYSSLPFMTSALNAPEWPNIALDLACAAALSLLVAAAAGPRVWISVYVSPAVAICLDTSGSMNARDIRPSRALAALRAVRGFVNGAPLGARFSLVSFAGTAQLVASLTGDRRRLLQRLSRVPAPNGQTAIGDGLLAAATSLPDRGARRIILITDGVNNRGEDPRGAVRKLAASGIRLDVIAIGNLAAALSLRSFALQTGGTFARTGSGVYFASELLRMGSRGSVEREPRDCTVAFAISGLVLGAAAWFAAAGAARS